MSADQRPEKPRRRRSSSQGNRTPPGANAMAVTETGPAEIAMSEERAIEVAKQATRGLIDIPAPVSAVVERIGDQFVVTFPTNLDPGVRGADYHARITMDAKTGRVEEILGGH